MWNVFLCTVYILTTLLALRFLVLLIKLNKRLYADDLFILICSATSLLVTSQCVGVVVYWVL